MKPRPRAIEVPAPNTPRPRPPDEPPRRAAEDPRAYAQALAEALSQDALDGAALRRLREMCPTGERWFEVFGPHPEDGHFQVVVTTVGKYDEPGIRANGATIAEAADACREALSGTPSGTRPEDGTAR